jgi:hypothetical protein
MKHPTQTHPRTRLHDNDNEVSSFQPIGLAASRLLLKLNEQHHPDSERDGAENHQKEKKDAEREKYIAQRLRDIERFEQLYRAAIKGRR